MTGKPDYKTPEEMQIKINEYFEYCDNHTVSRSTLKNNEPVEKQVPSPIRYTVPGLADFLGFAHRKSLCDYAAKDAFCYTVSRAKQKIEVQRAESLVDPDTKNVNGIKFDLQNNFDYHEKVEQDINLNADINVNISFVPGKKAENPSE